jgi:hypothetical protein
MMTSTSTLIILHTKGNLEYESFDLRDIFLKLKMATLILKYEKYQIIIYSIKVELFVHF